MAYNWQHNDWPRFPYELEKAMEALYGSREKLGHVFAASQTLPEEVQVETQVAEAFKGTTGLNAVVSQ